MTLPAVRILAYRPIIGPDHCTQIPPLIPDWPGSRHLAGLLTTRDKVIFTIHHLDSIHKGLRPVSPTPPAQLLPHVPFFQAKFTSAPYPPSRCPPRPISLRLCSTRARNRPSNARRPSLGLPTLPPPILTSSRSGATLETLLNNLLTRRIPCE